MNFERSKNPTRVPVFGDALPAPATAADGAATKRSHRLRLLAMEVGQPSAAATSGPAAPAPLLRDYHVFLRDGAARCERAANAADAMKVVQRHGADIVAGDVIAVVEVAALALPPVEIKTPFSILQPGTAPLSFAPASPANGGRAAATAT